MHLFDFAHAIPVHGVTFTADTDTALTNVQHYFKHTTRASQVVLVVKNLPANAGDVRHTGSIPGLGRSPGRGHGNPLQYSCLENPTDRGAWWALDFLGFNSAYALTGYVTASCLSLLTSRNKSVKILITLSS